MTMGRPQTDGALGRLLNAQIQRPPATTAAIQDAHTGISVVPTWTGHWFIARITCRIATSPKIAPETRWKFRTGRLLSRVARATAPRSGRLLVESEHVAVRVGETRRDFRRVDADRLHHAAAVGGDRLTRRGDA